MTYEMLTGRLPFTGESQAALLVAHVNDDVPDVRDVDPLIPEAVAEWVARMTQKDPEDRFPDADTAWEAFEEAVLEFIGPLWRRDATLEPASAVDLSNIPAQTDTPMRPEGAKPQAPASAPGGSTGYQTYHAPAALHELLGTDEAPAAPAVATPPPRPAVRPPRHVTAPPIPTVKGEPDRVEREKRKRAAEEESKPVPVGAIIGGAVVVAIIAFVLGMSGGGSPAPASASGDGFVLQAPAGWKPGAADASAGLGKGAVALAPAGAAQAEGIAAGRIPTGQAAGLVRGGSDRKLMKLDAGDAVRVSASGATLYVLPTDAGAVVVGCRGSGAIQDACSSSAGSLKLTKGSARSPGPTDEGQRVLTGTLSRLRDAIRNPSEDLKSAKSAKAQATAGGDLSKAYRKAAGELRKASLGTLVGGARDQLAGALKATADAWSSFAKAAKDANSGAVSSAKAAVESARSRITRARAALEAAGYPGGGG
jgi:hypothetical protein